MTQRKQFVSGFSWNSLTVVLQVVIQVVYTGLFARLVSPDTFALMGVVLSIMGFAEIFSQIGIGPALIQRKEVAQEHINAAFYTSLLLGLGFTLVFVACAPWIAAMYQLPQLEPIIQVVCSSFTISALSVVPRSLMMKEMRFKAFFNASMVSIIGGNLVVGLVLAYHDFQVWAYVWALFAQNALMALAYWWLHPVKLTRRWSASHTRDLVRYGTGSTLFNALNYAATKVDVTLIPLFVPRPVGVPQEVALKPAAMYERASYVMSLPITIMGKLSDNVLFSGMAKMQEDEPRLRKLMLAGTNLLALAIAPLCAFLVFYGGDIIYLWLGADYQSATPILQWLLAAIVFRTLSRLGDALLRARDAVFRGSWIKAVYVVLMIVGVIFTAPIGMNAVALSISVTTLVHYAMNLYLCRRLIGLSLGDQIKALLPSIVLSALTFIVAGVSAFLMGWLDIPPLLRLLLGAATTGSVLLLFIYNSPKLLGHATINPLNYLPEKLTKISVIKSMKNRISAP